MKVFVKVVTLAKREKIEKSEDGLKVWLKSKPVENNANLELIKIIAAYFRVSQSNLKMLSGLKSRNKILEVFLDETKN